MALRPIGTFVAGALLASALTFTGMQSWQAGAAPGDGAAVGGSREFTGGGTFHFVCWNPDGDESRVTGPQLNALVFPFLLRAPPPPPT